MINVESVHELVVLEGWCAAHMILHIMDVASKYTMESLACTPVMRQLATLTSKRPTTVSVALQILWHDSASAKSKCLSFGLNAARVFKIEGDCFLTCARAITAHFVAERALLSLSRQLHHPGLCPDCCCGTASCCVQLLAQVDAEETWVLLLLLQLQVGWSLLRRYQNGPYEEVRRAYHC